MIIGFSLGSVAAEKHGGKQGELNINYSSNFVDVEETSIGAIDEPVARIEFELGIQYEQDDDTVANLDFSGTVLWQEDAADVIAAWDENASLDETVAAPVTNHVFRKCLTQAVGLADALELPSPVPMPQVRN